MIKEAFAAVLMVLTLPAAAQTRSDSPVTTTLVVPALTLPGQQEDADKVVCRRPQELPGKRLYGPEVCKPQRQWDELHAQGLDIAPDGQSVVESEKYRTIHCNSTRTC